MRKILNFPRNGLAVAKRVFGKAKAAALATGVAVTCALAPAAKAQTYAQQLLPAASHAGTQPVTGAVNYAYGNHAAADASAINAAYSVLSDESSVEPASHSRRQQRQAAFYPKPQNPCYAGCDVSWYFNYDALWLKREGDDFFSNSRNTFLPAFDYEFGGRYTIGSLFDCVNGQEIVYTGPYDWERGRTLVSLGGNLQSQLSAQNGYTAGNLSAFNNATVHTQLWRSNLHSFEYNRRWWVWDVLSTMIGGRYIDYEEDYAFFSTSAAGNGTQLESVDNQMAGVQAGFDMLYPVSLRANVGVKGKGGVFANFDERRTFLNNAGTVLLNAGDSDVDVAGLIELGIFGNYAVVPSVRLTAGYELWWMGGMATIPEQRPSIITPSTGTTVFDSDDVVLHGGYVGVQVLY